MGEPPAHLTSNARPRHIISRYCSEMNVPRGTFICAPLPINPLRRPTVPLTHRIDQGLKSAGRGGLCLSSSRVSLGREVRAGAKGSFRGQPCEQTEVPRWPARGLEWQGPPPLGVPDSEC